MVALDCAQSICFLRGIFMKKYSVLQLRLSYIFKTIIILASVIGSFLSAYLENRSYTGTSTVFMYFTIQSNVAMAIISAFGICMLLAGAKLAKFWHIIQFVGTTSITLTGVVFTFMLAPVLGIEAWNFPNVLTHVVVPVVSVVDFFVISGISGIDKKNVKYVVVPPIAYAIYAGIGYVLNWNFAEGVNYPYFFLNWGSPAGAFGFSSELPYLGTVWWILILMAFLIAVGFCYLFIGDLLRKRLDAKAQAKGNA